MVLGVELFFALFNNLAILIALVALYGLLFTRLQRTPWALRQAGLGVIFGAFAISCMFIRIPVHQGVIVDQRNTIVALSGAFGGPLSAVVSAAIAGAFRASLGGGGVLAGVTGVCLAALAGIGMNRLSDRFGSPRVAALSALASTLVILPGFLLVGQPQEGFQLMLDMSLPYGSAIFLGILLGGLILRREEDREHVKRLLEDSEERYRELVESSRDLITQTDARGNLTFVNHACEALLGAPPRDCIGVSAFDFVHEDDRARTSAWFAEHVARGARIGQIENRQVNRHTGEVHYVQWWSSFRYDAQGALASVASIARDVTEQHKLEAQLQQSQRLEALGRLAGGIAHDFNNILVPILGYVDLAATGLPDNDPVQEDLQAIRQAGERASGLTKQILAFSRRQVLRMETLDLRNTLTGFKSMIQRLIGEDIQVLVHNPADLDLVDADEGQIEQILLNLVINARDAMPDGGVLTIETDNVYLDEKYVEKYAETLAPGPYVMLAVSDTGHGIDAETRARIFEPFFTTKARGKGTGLGLATVFGIVRQHRGSIWVYSEPGHGATFKVYLPRSERTAVERRPVGLEPLSLTGSEVILVAEDDEMVRKLVCETLSSHGYHVIEASTPEDGLRLAREHTSALHLLLTDVVMPQMHGRALYKEVVALHPEAKVLFMSGYTENVIVHHGVLDDTVDFVQKPFSVRELAARVRQALDR
ncbi:MAG: PAS domain S-box protein [Deltaproteobacteria bacterium]|nr:PAS domain S-box protein [Deltaproteobacteria bacterium]